MIIYHDYVKITRMKKKDKIYFHKEDVWKSAPHWMSSASRDLFETFYKSIKSSFLNKFKDDKIKEIVEKIHNVRKYERAVFSVAYKIAKKEIDYSLDAFPIYEEKRLPLPDEQEFDDERNVVPKDKMTFDPIVYSDFEYFFYNADHGFFKTDSAIKTVYDLWILFMKEFTIEDLEKQFSEELEIAMKWDFYLKKYSKQYLEDGNGLNWHRYLSNNLKDVDFYNQNDDM